MLVRGLHALGHDKAAPGQDQTVDLVPEHSASIDREAILRDRLVSAENELGLIKRSRSWRLARRIARIANALR